MKLNALGQGSRLVKGVVGVVGSSALFSWVAVASHPSEKQSEEKMERGWTEKLPGLHEVPSMSHLATKGALRLFKLWSVKRTLLEASVGNDDFSAEKTSSASVGIFEYDFVVLGNGNAGKSAIQVLRKQCPGASIALVDPLRPHIQENSTKVDYYPFSSIGFHPPTRTVQLADPNTQLQYRHAILVATGSRGAPPPLTLFDDQILDRVLELRPTDVPGNCKRPVLAPETVRRLALMAASQGAKICVLGSGWEAVELAVAASKAGKEAPLLAFGSAGPLCHILPRYLSTAVTKRLRQQGIDIQERSLVRYVAHNVRHGTPRLEVHAAKSFDMLDTQRFLVDLLVVAPYVDGPRGTAVVPTDDAPELLGEFGSGRTWYQSWSQLTSPKSEPSTVVCFSDDGRISVNAELNAASKVYCAGSVAKYPNSITGHAHVAGEGSVDGALAGKLAALHMVRDYQERIRSVLSARTEPIEPASFASQSYPIFRSDITPYISNDGHLSSLSTTGIETLVVGNCDSEKMSTHGFWWTNAAERRLSKEDSMPDSARRRKTNRTGNQSVYGVGIVYYLDRRGRIRGVMTWGFPFTNPGSTELNQELLDRLKQIINTNGGISRERADEDPLLRTDHLSEEAKRLVGIALATQVNGGVRRRLSQKAGDLPKPLHRYTAAKPASVTSIGLLKRKDQSVFSELLGENIYIRDDDSFNESEGVRPPTLLYIYPMHSPQRHRNEDENKGDDPYRPSLEDRVGEAWKQNELRARPPKEEPLWLRRGDAYRGVSVQELMAESFLHNMRSGKFADGSDAVQQAKVPKVLQDASRTLRQWMGQESADGDDDESQE